MPNCGSQVVLCDLPIRLDTYKGCSHACKYCFVQRKKDLSEIEKGETSKALLNFINGQRSQDTSWCDWNIPLHWGGMSDPFQPCEKRYRLSLECLKVFAETQYPFVVSTKGELIIEKEYLKVLRKCNCVVQISMICSKYDKLEAGAPSFQRRLEMVKVLSKNVKRVNIRIQPYMTQVFQDVLSNVKKFAEAGAYGIIVEGMKFAKKKDGLEKVGADFAYNKKILEQQFIKIKEEAHKYNLKFYCGENRLRTLGDDMCCCGIDNLEGFIGNSYNLCHLLNNKDIKITEAMKEKGSATCFKCIHQNTLDGQRFKNQSFEFTMKDEYKTKRDVYNKIFGKV